MATKHIYVLSEFDSGNCEAVAFNEKDDAMKVAENDYHLNEDELAEIDQGFIVNLPSGSSLVLKCTTLT